MFINSHLILHGVFIIIVIYLILVGIIRAKMQFWRTQPVFHVYNLKYWLKPPGFINLEPPAVNKFVNLVNNELLMVDNDVGAVSTSTTIKLKQICNFIRDYYVIHPNAKYRPSEEDIMAYLQSTNHSSFFNVYYEPRFLFDYGKEHTITEDKDIIGVASARVLNVAFFSSHKNNNSFAVYYVDNLCVKPGHRKKGIPPQMIQTFYYNVARQNKKVNAYMFKREGSLTAIVPLVYFITHGFYIAHFATDIILNPSMNVIAIGLQQLNVLIGFIQEQKRKFECVVLPDVSSIINLIKLEKLLIYGVLSNDRLIAMYIFRPLELYYDELGGKTVECITIVSDCTNISSNSSNSSNSKDILIAGFNMSLLKVKEKCNVTTLLLEETAHASAIVSALSTNSSVLHKFQSPTAFYLYNYACYTIANDKTLLVY